jgi:hypothetical protein
VSEHGFTLSAVLEANSGEIIEASVNRMVISIKCRLNQAAVAVTKTRIEFYVL